MVLFQGIENQSILDKDVVFCNPGSYGVVPKCVLELKRRYEWEMDENPDLWFRKTSLKLWLENRKAISNLFHTNPANFAFVPNVTHAINAVLSSIIWQPGDVILVTNVTFATVRSACLDVPNRHPDVEVLVLEIPTIIESEQQLVELFTSAVDKVIDGGKTPRLAVVDAISSLPGIVFPFEKITRRLQAKSVQVFVDGAHASGHLPDLNLDKLQADYFAGSLHKWFFCPKGTSLFWCAPKYQATIRAPVAACDYSKVLPHLFEDPMSGRFFWQGTNDTCGYACVGKVLEFIESCGGLDEIHQHNTKLARKANEILLEMVDGAENMAMPTSCVPPFMFNIYGPDALKQKSALAPVMTLGFYEHQNTWAYVSRWNDRIFFRVGAQIFNKDDDYHKLAVAISNFAKS